MKKKMMRWENGEDLSLSLSLPLSLLFPHYLDQAVADGPEELLQGVHLVDADCGEGGGEREWDERVEVVAVNSLLPTPVVVGVIPVKHRRCVAEQVLNVPLEDLTT